MSTRPNGIAPAPAGYTFGAKAGRVAQAWQDAWDQLSRTEHTEGIPLAEKVAKKYDLKPASVIAHFHRMAAEGVLLTERRAVTVPVKRGSSSYEARVIRAFYRIAPGR